MKFIAAFLSVCCLYSLCPEKAKAASYSNKGRDLRQISPLCEKANPQILENTGLGSDSNYNFTWLFTAPAKIKIPVLNSVWPARPSSLFVLRAKDQMIRAGLSPPRLFV